MGGHGTPCNPTKGTTIKSQSAICHLKLKTEDPQGGLIEDYRRDVRKDCRNKKLERKEKDGYASESPIEPRMSP